MFKAKMDTKKMNPPAKNAYLPRKNVCFFKNGEAVFSIPILAEKDDDMRRLFMLGMAFLLAVGCELVDIIRGAKEEEEPEEVVRTEVFETLLMSALSYPEGYDWRQDAHYGEVPCSLMLMTEDSVLLSRPVGDMYCTASDIDMHRIVGGRLYEDWATDEETIIRCNGEIAYSMYGREMVISMTEQGGAMYSLGYPKSKGGYVLRKDGKIISQSTEVLPATPLLMDRGVLSFTGVSRDGKGDTQWCIVENGKILPVNHPSESARIVSLLRAGGKRHKAIMSKQSLFLAIDDEVFFIGLNPMDTYDPGDFLYDGYRGECYFDAVKTDSDGSQEYMVWKDGELAYSYPGEFRKAAWCVADGNLCILGLDVVKGKWIIMQNEMVCELEEGLKPLGSAAMLAYDGTLCIALVDMNDDAVLWKDGIVKSFGIHGFIDHLAIGEVTRRVYGTGRD